MAQRQRKGVPPSLAAMLEPAQGAITMPDRADELAGKPLYAPEPEEPSMWQGPRRGIIKPAVDPRPQGPTAPPAAPAAPASDDSFKKFLGMLTPPSAPPKDMPPLPVQDVSKMNAVSLTPPAQADAWASHPAAPIAVQARPAAPDMNAYHPLGVPHMLGFGPNDDPTLRLLGDQAMQRWKDKTAQVDQQNQQALNDSQLGSSPEDIKMRGDTRAAMEQTATDTRKEASAANKPLNDIAAEMTPQGQYLGDQAQQDALAKLFGTSKLAGENALALESQKGADARALHDSDVAHEDALMKALGVGVGGSKAGGASTQVGFKTSFDAKGHPTFAPVMGTNPAQMQERALSAMNEMSVLLDNIDQSLGRDPKTGTWKNGPPAEGLGQLGSLLGNKLGNAAYKAGYGGEGQAKIWAEGLARILGSMPFVVGSRAKQIIDQAMQHLPNPDASDAFNAHTVDQLRKDYGDLHKEILRAQYDPTAGLSDPGTYATPQGGSDFTVEELK